MGETLGHVVFLVIGMVIGAVILFLFCFIGGQCRFMVPCPPTSSSYETGTCSSHAQTCGYIMPLTGSNLSSTSSYQNCCNGLACVGGYCRQPGEICMTGGQLCGTGPSPTSHPIPDYYGECCAGYQCDSGYCKTTSSCASQGYTCNYDSDCCSGLTCSGGKCVTTACTTSGSCTSNADCCENYYCNVNASPSECFAVNCGLSGYSPCYSDNDCCSGLVCTNDRCAPQLKQCSQITPQTPSDCDLGICSGGLCHYLPARHLNNNPSQPIAENAKCWCDLCAQTPANSDSIWVKGNCNNGTIAYTDYCDQEGGDILHNTRCFNYTTYIQATGSDTAYSGYPLGSCTTYNVNCSLYNARCYDGACVNFTCKTSGSCITTADCCSSYYCSDGECKKQCMTSGACTNNSDCCSPSACINGYCNVPQTCSDTTTTCANSSQCCPGNYCHYDNTCHSTPCASSGGSCETNTGCCSPYACISGYCSIPPTCQTSGRCNTDTDCCSSYYCSSNYQCTICQTAGSCTKSSQCCYGSCHGDGFCSMQVCKSASATCNVTSDCCYGLYCSYGVCTSCQTSGRCTTTADCCSGYYCGSNYYCTPTG
ncbi:hypothetical protein H0N98_05140 [Candidatus Micrarchaeota archaeon]|nr:hypothetical protein [Candidatus Micrarchaeota archaeon]